MTEEEKVLTDRYGRDNHFRTPEHYFDTLPQRVMARIPHKDTAHMKWRWAAAAILTGCVAASGLMFMHYRDAETELSFSDKQFVEDALDYFMIDNNEIATYLTEAEQQ